MTQFIGYRCAAWETPCWYDPNPQAGRYNRAGEAPTTYLGLHPLTPWAEYLRAGNARVEADLLNARPPTWAVRIDLDPGEFIELTFDDPGPLAPDDLVSDDWAACQALAAGLRSDEDPLAPKAIIAPSAALPGTRNLILLAPRVLSPYLTEPIDRFIDTPGAATAVDGHAPLNLLDMVHRRASGARHPGLAAWEEGEETYLQEPELRPDEIAATTGIAPPG